MKKFLVFLFITISTSVVVKVDVDLENLLTGIAKRVFGLFEKALNWLKSTEFYAQIENLLKTYGGPAALELCKNVLPLPFASTICEKVIDFIAKTLDIIL